MLGCDDEGKQYPHEGIVSDSHELAGNEEADHGSIVSKADVVEPVVTALPKVLSDAACGTKRHEDEGTINYQPGESGVRSNLDEDVMRELRGVEQHVLRMVARVIQGEVVEAHP